MAEKMSDGEGKMVEKERHGESNGNLELTEEEENVVKKEKNSKAINEREISLINRVLPPEILETFPLLEHQMVWREGQI